MCEYTIQFASRHACPAGGLRGPLHGYGWRLIILLFLSLSCYLGVGGAPHRTVPHCTAPRRTAHCTQH
jgi:hypothetical protein